MNTSATQAQRALWARVLSDKRALVSLLYLLGPIALAVLAPLAAPFPPNEQDYSQILMPPGATHWLGTDDVGRDIFSRLILGAPASLFGSLFAVGIAIAYGLPFGLFSRTDERRVGK